jgi:cation transport ATPase
MRARPGHPDRDDVGTGRGAAFGVLIKGGEVLERSKRVKTGCWTRLAPLTRGETTLTDMRSGPGQAEHELLAWAAAVEAGSDHPVGCAIVVGAARRGHGVHVLVEGIHVVSAAASSWPRPAARSRGRSSG